MRDIRLASCPWRKQSTPNSSTTFPAECACLVTDFPRGNPRPGRPAIPERPTACTVSFIFSLLLSLVMLFGCQTNQPVAPPAAATLSETLPPAAPTQPAVTGTSRATPISPGATSVSSGDTSTPIRIALWMERAPCLNEPVSVTVTVKTAMDTPNTTAALELPPAAQLVSGTITYKGDLKRDQPVQFNAVIKFGAEGDQTVQARALCVISQDMTWGDLAVIYLHVGRDASHFGFEQHGLPPAPADAVPTPPAVAP